MTVIFYSNKNNTYSELKTIIHSNYFDQDWYIKSYPEVAESKLSPIDHFIEVGGAEGLSPSLKFNSRWYLETYQDVAAARCNPLVHFLEFGIHEGRLPRPGASPHWKPRLRAMAARLVSRVSLPGFLAHLNKQKAEVALYQKWIETCETPSHPSPAEMKAAIAAMTFKPRISIVMPVYNTPAAWLNEAIGSILKQSYENWELCLCDDNSSARHIRPILEKYAASDPRVKIIWREKNGHISAATNDAMRLATGEYMTLMDHDDLIPDNALFEFARALNTDPTLDFIYSDEDKITEGGLRYDPFFKPDWSPEYLESCMYTAHLALYRMDIVGKIGGFRPECNGAQDYDFVLRYTEHARNVKHIPRMLYHWRAIDGSTAQSMDNKSYVLKAALNALGARAERTGELDFVRNSPFPGCFALRRKLTSTPLISIVIPSAGGNASIRGVDINLLTNCIESVHSKSTYKNIEIIVVDNGDLSPELSTFLRKSNVVAVTYARPEVNIAAKMNLGARAAKGDVLLFLNDDIEVITNDWLEAMLALLQRPGVGAVGPKLLFEDGRIQHVGVTFCESLPDHVRRGYPGGDPGYMFSGVGNRNYMAVTGACVMLTRADFEAVGGFDEELAINYNDIDLTMKIHANLGKRIVYCGQASLFHYESQSRVRTVAESEQKLFHDRWRALTRRDPYYSEWFEARPPTFELAPNNFHPMEPL